ncbi:hypothetical protein Y1Q_0017232 [Alligator mississippiensis]|uniref:Uncharacterized protein n=1 Tax=Alligator mississippiensis TaxID=8496 RepID=A0A151NKU3_ALLMI|nr:hypothetical protein Y1Q_0017232 [Alligator mississippiensis]
MWPLTDRLSGRFTHETEKAPYSFLWKHSVEKQMDSSSLSQHKSFSLLLASLFMLSALENQDASIQDIMCECLPEK